MGTTRDQPYVGDRIVHDADSHVLETPGWLLDHVDPDLRPRLAPLWMRGLGPFAEGAAAKMDAACADPEQRADLEEHLLDRKNWWALGATRPTERSAALDLLGFSSQLVFSTHSSRTMLAPSGPGFDGSEADPLARLDDPDLVYGLVRAHNRALASFCSTDPRLLAVGWLRLDDPSRAVHEAVHALDLGCAALEIPSYPLGPCSLTHPALDPIYSLLEEAGRPLIFHLGSGGEIPNHVFRNNGRPEPVDPRGNADRMRPLRSVGLVGPVEMALAALILDGVLEDHPRLAVGVIEHGSVWVPGFMRRLDLAVDLDRQMRSNEMQVGDLPMPPSEYVLRQVRFTPFPAEPLEWVIEQSDPRLYLFSTDYPHAEGGTDPYGEFNRALAAFDDVVQDQFFRRNFEQFISGNLPV